MPVVESPGLYEVRNGRVYAAGSRTLYPVDGQPLDAFIRSLQVPG